jgi:hypothetical protein
MDGHEEFRELCAISVSGELSGEEQAKLDEHLHSCSWCQEVFRQYRATVVSVVPRFAAEAVPSERVTESSWNARDAEATLFERLKIQESEFSPQRSRNESAVHKPRYVPPSSRSKELGMLYAAGILLFLALTIASYRLGTQDGARNAAASMASSTEIIPEKDQERLVAELAERDQTISGLKQEIASKGTRQSQERVRSVRSIDPGSPDPRMAELEKQLTEVERTRSEEAVRSTALEAKAGELEEQLRDRQETVGRQRLSLSDSDRKLQSRDQTISDQQDLLAHDRDIRELMGERNLYIAEVYDVAKTGETSKPFGRVFYTKGKSLIFYAYDLEPSEKRASFQVWGREGADQAKTINLGVFYEDSVANKRWVLKSEDTQSLEQIDAVFVTVEPNGGSQKPSGKPMLFAYLKTAPNHP